MARRIIPDEVIAARRFASGVNRAVWSPASLLVTLASERRRLNA